MLKMGQSCGGHSIGGLFHWISRHAVSKLDGFESTLWISRFTVLSSRPRSKESFVPQSPENETFAISTTPASRWLVMKHSVGGVGGVGGASRK
jgi:hypothetical protein